MSKKTIKTSLKDKSNISADLCSEDYKLFFHTSSKKDNDNYNKRRENFLVKLADDSFKTDDENILEFRKKLVKVLNTYITCSYDSLKLIPRGGRKYNYDFDLEVYRNMFLQETFKIEFKYGSTNIYSIPQFLSIYANNPSFQFIKLFTQSNSSYVDYYYKNCYRQCMEILGLEHKSYGEFLKNINKNEVVEEIMKLDNKKKEQCYSIVDEGIKKYLHSIKLTNTVSLYEGLTIDFDIIQKTFNNQRDKIYLFCESGVFNTCKYENFIIDKTRFSIKNNNTLCIFDTDNIRSYHLLLRWKNRKAAGGPAWQISVKNLNSNSRKFIIVSKDKIDIPKVSTENIKQYNITSLKSIAQSLGIKGYSKYNKSNKNELETLILKALFR